jgi:hypothetical protein
VLSDEVRRMQKVIEEYEEEHDPENWINIIAADISKFHQKRPKDDRIDPRTAAVAMRNYEAEIVELTEELLSLNHMGKAVNGFLKQGNSLNKNKKLPKVTSKTDGERGSREL